MNGIGYTIKSEAYDFILLHTIENEADLWESSFDEVWNVYNVYGWEGDGIRFFNYYNNSLNEEAHITLPNVSIKNDEFMGFYINISEHGDISIHDSDGRKRKVALASGGGFDQIKIYGDCSNTQGDRDFDFNNIIKLSIGGSFNSFTISKNIGVYRVNQNDSISYENTTSIWLGNTSSWGPIGEEWFILNLNHDYSNDNVFDLQYHVYGGDYRSILYQSFISHNRLYYLR